MTICWLRLLRNNTETVRNDLYMVGRRLKDSFETLMKAIQQRKSGRYSNNDSEVVRKDLYIAHKWLRERFRRAGNKQFRWWYSHKERVRCLKDGTRMI